MGLGKAVMTCPNWEVPVVAKATLFNMLVANMFLGSPERKPKG